MKLVTGSVALSIVMGLVAPALAQDATGEAPKSDGSEAPPEATAEAEGGGGVSFSVELAVASSYVWRGSLLSSSKFEPCLQPYVEIGYEGLGPGTLAAGVWMNQSVTEDDNSANREFDLYASYTLPVSIMELKLGYIVYIIPELDPADSQHEFSAQATFDLSSGFSSYVGIAWDPIRLKGIYANAGFGYGQTVSGIDLSAALNLGISKYEGIDTDLQDVTVTVGASKAIGESGLYAAIRGGLGYAGRGEDANGDRVYPYGIVAVGFSK